MQTPGQINSVAWERRRAYLKRAIEENRGREAITALNRLALNRRETYKEDDQTIISSFENAAYAARENRRETRDLILDCLRQTDFSREESDPQIRQYMVEDLEEQNFVIHLLQQGGIPAHALPSLNLGIARLNAIERKNNRPQRWSINDEYQVLRAQVHAIPPAHRQLLGSIGPSANGTSVTIH